MADQIQRATTTGATIYALVRDAAGKVFNGSAFETYLTANRGAYDLPMSEQGTASGHYAGAFPASIPAGTYLVSAPNHAGGPPAAGDPLFAAAWTESAGAGFAGSANTATPSLTCGGSDPRSTLSSALTIDRAPTTWSTVRSSRWASGALPPRSHQES